MSKREKNDLNGTLGMGLDSKKSGVEVENKVGEKKEKNYFVIVDNPEDNKSNGTKKDNKKEERIEIQKIDGSLNGIKTNFVTEDRVKEISDELSREYKKINKEMVKERVWENGKKITVSSYREFEEKVNRKFEPTLYLNFNRISENLKKLKKNNLYDFLNSEKLTLNFWDNQKVQEKIEGLKTNDVDSSLKKTLYSFCQILVERDQIEKYNEYLEQMECLKIKDGLDEAKNRVERFKEESFESQTEIFVNKFRDVLEEKVAKNIFEEYFKDELDKEKELKEKQSSHKKSSPRSKKKSVLLTAMGIVCLVAIFLLRGEINKYQAEKLFYQASKFEAKGDTEKSKKLYKKAAIKGNKPAMYHLGSLYIAEDNREKAKYWYEKLAKKGDVATMMDLGSIYEEEGNSTRAKYWYKRAADNGNKPAMYHLGSIYEFTEKNIKEAKYWYKKADAAGSGDTKKN